MRMHRELLLLMVAGLSTLTFAQSDARKSFDQLKTLAGVWTGSVSVDPPQPQWDTGKQIWVTMRVTSRGNALVHEMKQPGTPDDPTKDDPLTMLYMDGDRLMLTHYCDAGNRPRMVAKPSLDGKTIDFEFADVAGSTQYGHMHQSEFKIIDANHHTEDWNFMMPGDKMVRGHMDLQRVK